MLAIADVTVSLMSKDTMRDAGYALFGFIVDAAFLLSGWVDEKSGRVWFVLAGTDIDAINQRLAVLAGMRDGTAASTVTPVTALCFR